MFVLAPTTTLNVAILLRRAFKSRKETKGQWEIGRSCSRVATAWRRVDQACITIAPRCKLRSRPAQRRARSYARRVVEIRLMPLALNVRQCWGVHPSQSGKRDMRSNGKQNRYQLLRQTPTISEALRSRPLRSRARVTGLKGVDSVRF